MEWLLICDVPGCIMEDVPQSVVGESVACSGCGGIKEREGK